MSYKIIIHDYINPPTYTFVPTRAAMIQCRNMYRAFGYKTEVEAI